MKTQFIGDLVGRVRQFDPAKLGRDSFRYIDISSLDRDSKCLLAAERIAVSAAPSRARQMVQAGDVLVSTVRPNLNAVAQVPSHYDGEIASTGFCILRPDSAQVDPRFLFYFTQTSRFVAQLMRVATGASYPAVTDSDVLEARIPLPPLSEQRRIAGVLEQADRLRRTRRYALELSAAFLPAAFRQLLGDLTGCRLVTLDDVCEKITDGTHHTPTYQSDGVPFLSVKNVNTPSGELDFDDVRYISRTEHEQLVRRCKPEFGDILYTKVGATFGIPKVINTHREFSIFVSLALLKPNHTRIDSRFLEAALSSDKVFQQAKTLVSGIAVPDLHLREIKTFQIPLPPLPVQQQFASLVARHERLRAVHREALRQAEHLFQSLLHRAFTT